MCSSCMPSQFSTSNPCPFKRNKGVGFGSLYCGCTHGQLKISKSCKNFLVTTFYGQCNVLSLIQQGNGLVGGGEYNYQWMEKDSTTCTNAKMMKSDDEEESMTNEEEENLESRTSRTKIGSNDVNNTFRNFGFASYVRHRERWFWWLSEEEAT